MSCETATAQVLRESGQRLTPQRLLILSALRHAEGHVAASQILERVKESYPYIDASTVYRTLSVLKGMRMVSETDMGGGEYSYEWLGEVRHHHLVCRRCEKVTNIDHTRMEALADEILDDYGFEADVDHFAIAGLCDVCRPVGTHGVRGDR